MHNKIKIHHHISIWAISTLAVMAIGSIYAKQSAALAEDSGAGRPSASTQKFFGEGEDNGKNRDNSTPAECQQQNAAEDSDYRAKVQQQGQLQGQISALRQKLPTAATPEEAAQYQAQIADLQKQSDALGVKEGDRSQQANSGPTGACKTAIVAQQKSHMVAFRDKINGSILPTFTKVDIATNNIEAKIPSLEAAGVDKTNVDKIKADISSIRSNAKTTKAFFQGMLSTINDFLAVADTDPDAAFSKMKDKFGQGGQNSAGKNADALVAAFTDIEKIVDGLK